MKLDPVKFKEHLVRMRRDREMQRAGFPDSMEPGIGPAVAMARAAAEAIADSEIKLLNEIYRAVEDSMETDGPAN